MMQFPERLEPHRLRTGAYSSAPGDRFGAFIMPGPSGRRLRIIACDGDVDDELGGWEHVSVTTPKHVPNWIEMCFVKNLFWPPEDCVVQFHPPLSDYVNNHPRCLHLWRWLRGTFPMPPSLLVGIKQLSPVEAAFVARCLEGGR